MTYFEDSFFPMKKSKQKFLFFLNISRIEIYQYLLFFFSIIINI